MRSRLKNAQTRWLRGWSSDCEVGKLIGTTAWTGWSDVGGGEAEQVLAMHTAQQADGALDDERRVHQRKMRLVSMCWGPRVKALVPEDGRQCTQAQADDQGLGKVVLVEELRPGALEFRILSQIRCGREKLAEISQPNHKQRTANCSNGRTTLRQTSGTCTTPKSTCTPSEKSSPTCKNSTITQEENFQLKVVW